MAGDKWGHANDKDQTSQKLPTSSSSSLVIPLSETYVEAAARLYSEVFLEDEPTSRRHSLDPERFHPYACFYVRSLVKKELSFLARDGCSGEITGFIFCFDLMDDPDREGPQMKEFLLQFRQAVAMIDELEARPPPPRIDRARVSPAYLPGWGFQEGAGQGDCPGVGPPGSLPCKGTRVPACGCRLHQPGIKKNL